MSIMQGNDGHGVPDPLGQGRMRCRSVGLGTVKLFFDRLIARAQHGPLSADTLRDEYALFTMGDNADVGALFDPAYDGCVTITYPLRRHQAFERALVHRLESVFDGDEASGGAARLSRRLIPGLFHATSEILGDDPYEGARAHSAVIAAGHGEETDLSGSPDLRQVVDQALLRLATAFVADFERMLASFMHLVNGRLADPVSGRWDAEWRLDPYRAVVLLDLLYAGLRPSLPEAFRAGLEDTRARVRPAG